MARFAPISARGLRYGEQPSGQDAVHALTSTPFEAISLLLVVAMIGAVLLAKRRL